MSDILHANALLYGTSGLLLRGPSGSGKSTLTLQLLHEAERRGVYAALVADDRTAVETINGRLVASPPAELAGLMEIRGLGIARLPHRPAAILTHVVDLVAAGWPDRLPGDADRTQRIAGLPLPRIALRADEAGAVERLVTALSAPAFLDME